jgi:hypothetical protein
VTEHADRFTSHYRARRFPSTMREFGFLSFTSSDLAHALFATGRAPGDRASYGQASVWEWIHRCSLIPAYLRITQGGRLVRSRLALDLDRSEKVALSYALGQAVTEIFCEQLLGVSHLMHVDRYAQRFGMTFGATRQRPDLFGRSPAGWVVAEAKGRSNGMEAALESKLIGQKRAVVSVAGAPPVTAIGCVMSFPPKVTGMRVDAFDPAENENDAVVLDIADHRFLLAYYEPFITAIDMGVRRDTDVHVLASIPGLGLEIGLERGIDRAVRAAMEGKDMALQETVQLLTSERSPDRSGYPDGSIVVADWSSQLRSDDWQA